MKIDSSSDQAGFYSLTPASAARRAPLIFLPVPDQWVQLSQKVTCGGTTLRWELGIGELCVPLRQTLPTTASKKRQRYLHAFRCRSFRKRKTFYQLREDGLESGKGFVTEKRLRFAFRRNAGPQQLRVFFGICSCSLRKLLTVKSPLQCQKHVEYDINTTGFGSFPLCSVLDFVALSRLMIWEFAN